MAEPVNFLEFIALNNHIDPKWKTLLSGMCDAAIDVYGQLIAPASKVIHSTDCGINPHGEYQQHMDIFAENRFIYHLQKSNACCMILSEEQPEVIRLHGETWESIPPYMVALDPLDGSSNVAVNVPVGSIFSIYKKSESEDPISHEDMLRRGDEQLAAGYFLYGATTILVFACNDQVNGFTLDPAKKDFILSHPCIRIPADGTIYAVNDANYPVFSWGSQNFIRYCRQQAEMGDRAFTARYSGSMVSDIHRILLCGGIFLYPGTLSYPKGKLRLAYECFPIALIIEMAGGLAMNNSRRILDETLDTIHQRSPIVTGSANLVITAERFINTSKPSAYEFHI